MVLREARTLSEVTTDQSGKTAPDGNGISRPVSGIAVEAVDEGGRLSLKLREGDEDEG